MASTLLSMFLSHMSLMVQPAPRITKEPAAKVARRGREGSWPGEAARQILGGARIVDLNNVLNQQI